MAHVGFGGAFKDMAPVRLAMPLVTIPLVTIPLVTIPLDTMPLDTSYNCDAVHHLHLRLRLHVCRAGARACVRRMCVCARRVPVCGMHICVRRMCVCARGVPVCGMHTCVRRVCVCARGLPVNRGCCLLPCASDAQQPSRARIYYHNLYAGLTVGI